MKVIAIIALFFAFGSVKAQKSITKTFKTSAICDQCEGRLEDNLNYQKGISYADFDVPTKTLTVKWNPKKISEAEIKQFVAEIGYDIDDIKANEEKRAQLPSCCQPHAAPHH